MNSRTRTRRRTRTNRIYTWCAWIDKARAVWLNLCPLRGRLPKWPTGADCKSAGFAFDGSNPSPTTILRSKRSGERRLSRRNAVKADANQFSNHKRSELRLGGPAKFLQQRSEDEGCRAEARSAQAGRFKVVTAGCGPASRHFRLPIYDLAAGGHKLQMKSSAKDEVKKKEAGHYSGLSMRTKRLNQHLVAALLRTFCWLRRRIHTPCFTHGTLRFCIPTMRLRYQRPCPLPVTSSGYTQTFENKGKSLKFD